ncbi:MAG TPA: winged helix-turn-helix domain-containing protein [Terriglobales bacterium]|nr:winged helix-turn-helix domain-containing protein [Terriglobales bacterium]
MAHTANVRPFPQRASDDEGGHPSTDVIDVGDFHIDLSARTATVRGRELRLTPEEFDLLMFLTSHPKKLVTPSTLLSTNWNRKGVQHAEFLRVLLSLRRKLEEDGPQHYIRTEPWVLYRFDPVAS